MPTNRHFPSTNRSPPGSIDGEVRDVCPGALSNTPGHVHFQSLSRVRRWGLGVAALTYFGCPIANLFAFFALKLRHKGQAAGT